MASIGCHKGFIYNVKIRRRHIYIFLKNDELFQKWKVLLCTQFVSIGNQKKTFSWFLCWKLAWSKY